MHVQKAIGSKMVAIGKAANSLRSRSMPGSRRHKKTEGTPRKSLSKVGILNSGFDDDAPCSETVSAGISLNDLRSQERSSDSISYNSFEDYLSCSKLANRKCNSSWLSTIQLKSVFQTFLRSCDLTITLFGPFISPFRVNKSIFQKNDSKISKIGSFFRLLGQQFLRNNAFWL